MKEKDKKYIEFGWGLRLWINNPDFAKGCENKTIDVPTLEKNNDEPKKRK